MRYALVLALLLACRLRAADLKIDHATIAGSNLHALQSALAGIGIPTVYGGMHTNGATEMAVASFPDGSYLELMALRANADSQQRDRNVWARFLKGDAGPCAWAVGADNMTAEVQRLRSTGITVSDPEKSGRQRPDGVHLEWEMSAVGGATRGTFFPFLIHDFTPRDQRAFPQGAPVTREFESVARVIIAVRDLDEAIGRYRRVYPGPGAMKQADALFGARLAMLGGLPVVLAQPLAPDSWLAKRIDRFGEAPCAILLAAAKASHHGLSSQSRWFGADIGWFDAEKLGWHLGWMTD